MTAPTGEHRAGVDPRLRARRQDVLRQQGRRRLRRLQAAAAVAAAGGAGWAVAASPLLDVDRVVVRGMVHGRVEDVEAAAGLEKGSPLLTVDLERVRAGAASVAWVADADVSRSWPASVLISVTERRPVAIAVLPDGATGVLVDAERQLGPTDVSPIDGASVDTEQLDGLPRVVGVVVEVRPGAPLEVAARGAVDLAGLLGHEVGRGAVPGEPMISVSANVQGELDVMLLMEDEVVTRVLFGPAVDLDDKVRTLVALLGSESLDTFGGAVVDVRVASAPVVTRGAP